MLPCGVPAGEPGVRVYAKRVLIVDWSVPRSAHRPYASRAIVDEAVTIVVAARRQHVGIAVVRLPRHSGVQVSELRAVDVDAEPVRQIARTRCPTRPRAIRSAGPRTRTANCAERESIDTTTCRSRVCQFHRARPDAGPGGERLKFPFTYSSCRSSVASETSSTTFAKRRIGTHAVHERIQVFAAMVPRLLDVVVERVHPELRRERLVDAGTVAEVFGSADNRQAGICWPPAQLLRCPDSGTTDSR